MSNTSAVPTSKELSGFSVHLPNAKLTNEEEAKRFNNLKSLIAKARTSSAPRK